MESTGPPWTIHGVESLILSLYEPGQLNAISTTQALLSKFQSSPQAWIIAHELLNRPDEKIKFFGVLTIIIKLNRESTSLSDNDAKELLEHLIGWYLDAFETSSSPLVPRKLSSALGTYFLHFHSLWPHYIRHLAICSVSGQYCDPVSVDHLASTGSIMERLDPNKLKALLWVITSITDDVNRIDWNAANKIGLYDSIVREASDATEVLTRTLGDHQLWEDGMKSLQSWICFAQRISSRDDHVPQLLRQLMPSVIESLLIDTRFESSAELLIEILSSYPSLLNHNHFELLMNMFVSAWSDKRFTRLLQGDMAFDSAQFGHLLLAFGEERCQWLMQSDDHRCKSLLLRLCGLLGADGYPVVENKVFVPAVEFWSTFTETMSELVSSDGIFSTPWAELAHTLILEAISNAWQKIIYPSMGEVSLWDSSDRAGFSDARKDVVDLLQSAYSLCGIRLVATFADLLLAALDDSAWLRLEAAAFCLAGLADCGKEDAKLDQTLTPVFGSSLFSNLTSLGSNIPSRTRQTCLYVIEQYTEYFERNVPSLAPALRLLFSLLFDQSMVASASRSILRLCSSCRHHLHTETDGFLDEYRILVNKCRLDCISSEKIMGAIASIAQAIPDDSRRYNACQELLNFVQQDVQYAQKISLTSELTCRGLRCLDNPEAEHPGLHVALKALRCLVSIGKGFQFPIDSSIDLISNDCRRIKDDAQLKLLHRKVMSIIVDIETSFGMNSEVIELITAVLRCGFSETEPGPFVLDVESVTEYLTAHNVQVSRPGLFATAACSFVSFLEAQKSPKKETTYMTLLKWVIGLLQQLPDPEHDPELTQSGIDFASRLLLKCPFILVALDPPAAAEFFFLFTIKVLDGSEPLPKGAAAEFWSTFIALRSDEPKMKDAFKQAMDALGPLLAQSLARNIGGQASRSELDKLSEPIKKLINRCPLAKEWLAAGLNHGSFPSDKITSEQKVLFVKKLVR